ncbi:MAG: SAM-dependent chlorinase/fluorinase [Solobacterium sp.]|nr:SAM-dependent chlorinase/fluorinase [Solobacterium sp.]
MKPIIVLQTDFSNTWNAVASMKGVIKLVDKELEIVDLCHEIKQFDPWEASLSLASTVPYWPDDTIFVSVVDPGVGTTRRAAAAKLNNGIVVITPDNGTLTHLKYHPGIAEVREIDETVNRFHPEEEVEVFHGRDLFGYTAAKLASGRISFAGIGPVYPVEEIVECEEYHRKPILGDRMAKGYVMTGLKHFGGVQFNITNAEWKGLGIAEGTNVRVCITHNGKTVFNEDVLYAASFGAVPIGAPVLYCGSSRYLSLDCNQGNFMDTYGVGFGNGWNVELTGGKE